MHKQKGLSLSGLLMASVILIIVAVIGVQIAPAYIEYFQIKKNLASVVKQAGSDASPAELKKSFDLKAGVDNIKAVSGNDLVITKEGNNVVLSVSYSVKTPLIGNLSACMDFTATSE